MKNQFVVSKLVVASGEQDIVVHTYLYKEKSNPCFKLPRWTRSTSPMSGRPLFQWLSSNLAMTLHDCIFFQWRIPIRSRPFVFLPVYCHTTAQRKFLNIVQLWCQCTVEVFAESRHFNCVVCAPERRKESKWSRLLDLHPCTAQHLPGWRHWEAAHLRHHAASTHWTTSRPRRQPGGLGGHGERR